MSTIARTAVRTRTRTPAPAVVDPEAWSDAWAALTDDLVAGTAAALEAAYAAYRPSPASDGPSGPSGPARRVTARGGRWHGQRV